VSTYMQSINIIILYYIILYYIILYSSHMSNIGRMWGGALHHFSERTEEANWDAETLGIY